MIRSRVVRVLQVRSPGASGTNWIVIKRGSGCKSIFGAEVGVKQLGHVLVLEDKRLHMREAFWAAYTVQIHNELLKPQPILPKSEGDERRFHCCAADGPGVLCKPSQPPHAVSEPEGEALL